MKRKALAITLAAAMAMGTCAVTASAADGDKYTIGICQLVQHEALDAATQGFKDEVTKELGEDAVTFDEQNAQGDSNTCSTIINSFVSNNVDIIIQADSSFTETLIWEYPRQSIRKSLKEYLLRARESVW